MSLLHRERTELAELSDAQLISLFRSGSEDAYGQLWARHLGAAIAAARAITDRVEPEDIASDAFLNVMQALRRGKGPDFAFRPYLLAAVRNTATRSGQRHAKDVPLDELELEDPAFHDESLLAAMDGTLLARGFATLPARWQEVLWYTEVEQLGPQEAARLMGVKPAAVASLAYRAREGLRKAWIKAHLAAIAPDSECRWAIDHLPARERGTLKPAERARLAAHLRSCDYCPIAAESAEDASRRLAPAALAALLGTGAIGGYLAWSGSSPASASALSALHPAPPMLPVPAGSAATRLSAKGLLIAGGSAVTAGVIVTAVLLWPGSAPEQSTSADVLSRSDAPAPPPPVTSTAPQPSRATPSATAPSPSRTASAAPSTPQSPVGEAGAAPAARSAATAPSAPVLSGVDTASGRYYPVLSGTGAPGATIVFTAGAGSYRVAVGADGGWTSPALSGLPLGVTTIGIRQSTAAGDSPLVSTNVDLAGVHVTAFGAPVGGVQQLQVSGVVGATVQLSSGGASVQAQLDSTGSGTASLPAAAGRITAFYLGDGRRGPATTTELASS